MNNNTFAHKYLKGLITKDDIVVDMTCGGGNDTYYLCTLAKTVYGFDIQKEAIEETRNRCKEFNNLILIQDSHLNVDKYIKDKPKLFIFNLGYYPKGDHQIVSKADETLIAFKKAYGLLQNNGYIVISFYLGHQGGKDEFYKIDKYINDHNLLVLEKYRQYRNALEPITYIIKKAIYFPILY